MPILETYKFWSNSLGIRFWNYWLIFEIAWAAFKHVGFHSKIHSTCYSMEKRSEFGIISNGFWSSKIWAFQIQVSFPEVPKKPGIQTYYFLILNHRSTVRCNLSKFNHQMEVRVYERRKFYSQYNIKSLKNWESYLNHFKLARNNFWRHYLSWKLTLILPELFKLIWWIKDISSVFESKLEIFANPKLPSGSSGE